ncbi:MAG: DEAD/DEAH box helicase [Myxococcales bacterium]|nr:DEAD/DEAH box helicase [Myxococcales bacterium]
MLQVQFADGVRWVPESQLEKIENQRLSPLDMLEAKKLGRPVDLRRTLTHVKLSGRLADVIYSMEATNTDFYAYQFKPVVKVLESPSNAILIADEVGLGKTIEAGLIWTELRSRFDMRRLLVLCPAALREKWRRELATKIGVAAQICDAGETLSLLRDDDSQSRGFAIVGSIQGLRPPRDWDDEVATRKSAQLARFLQSMENEERLVDLLVIDEAHHLRNPETRTNELGHLCKAVAEYCVFLTATPIHNRNEDLFSLLQLLDPDTFTRPEVFGQILEANAPLVRARDLVLSGTPSAAELQALLQQARSHDLLRTNRQLSMIHEQDIVPERLEQREVRSRLAYRLETVNLLAHVVTRTRKRDVKEWRVVRDPIPEFVELKPVEQSFYDLVTNVVVTYALRSLASERFLLAQPQRQMASSMAASLRSWQRKLVELEEAEETGEVVDDDRRKTLGPLVTEIVLRSRDYVDLDDLIKVDTKYDRLRSIVTRFLRDHATEKVVVFSGFRATLAYLAERLEADGVSCIQLKGGQRETKDETISRFRDPAGPSVLLSSEVGGEGVDLQFSRVLINYDLPWNPMRLEQRIGRIDRLGQVADKVLIWNVLYAETIDARIYQRLYEKLDLCRTTLGDFEAILGDAIRKLEIDLLSGRLSPEQQEQRIDQTAQALENLRHEEQRLEQDAAGLIAYGDYILNQVQAARELNRWISGEDLRRYVFDYLRLHYPGCDLRQADPDSPTFDVDLSSNAKFDLVEFMRSRRLPFTTRLTSTSPRPIQCRFENRVVGPIRASDEVISQFHPLVRMISSRINEMDEQLTPAVSLELDSADVDGTQIEPGTYALAAALWSFRALQDTEKLAYAATRLPGPAELLTSEDAERLAAAAVAGGRDWLEARNVVDLAGAYAVANDVLLGSLDEEYEQFTQELRARNEDRADIQLRTLQQHLQKQTKKLEAILARQRAKGQRVVRATEGRIQALRNRVEQQRLRIESRRDVRSEAREIAIAIIHIS